MKRIIFYILFFTLSLSINAAASPLDDLLSSSDFKSKTSSQELKELSDPKYFRKGTNFSNLFLDQNGQELLYGWMGRLGTGFDYKDKRSFREGKFVWAEKEYVSYDRENIKTRVLVPHPKYVEMIKLKLVPAIEKIVPKKYTNKEEFQAAGAKWTGYRVNDDQYCRAIANLAKETKVIVEVSPCKGIERAKRVARDVDVLTVHHKLDT